MPVRKCREHPVLIAYYGSYNIPSYNRSSPLCLHESHCLPTEEKEGEGGRWGKKKVLSLVLQL